MENRLIDSLRRADRFWLLDGAMGTQLQKKLVAAGRSILGLIPELCCITEPELVTQVHREYLEAGADILYTNTFGANRKKLAGSRSFLLLSAVPNRRQRGRTRWLLWTSVPSAS